jgi:hypothetical protein
MAERQIFSPDSTNAYGDIQKEHFNQFIESLDSERMNAFKDKVHPQDKNRSLLKDIETRMENYSKRKQKITGQNLINSREVGYIRSKLRDEYYPKPKKEEAPATDAK